MDISEFLPFLKLLLIPVAGWTIFRVAKRVRRRWLRLPIKMAASAVLVIGAAFLLLLVLFEAACTKHVPAIKSPDGRYVAVLSFAVQGALGDDYANVSVRAWWSPYAESIYSGVGSWDFKNNKAYDPEVRWLDRSHLLIRYRDDRTGNEGRGGPAVCRGRIGGVEIVCQHVPQSLGHEKAG
jgi:hypothetical protein